MENGILESLKTESDKILAKFREDVAVLRASRATPLLVENITVEYYGSKLPIKQIATISIQLPNIILIQPWDQNAVQPIERAIATSQLNISPVVDGQTVKVTLPSLTEERRKQLVKTLSAESEKAKISFRMARDEIRKKIQGGFEEKTVSEDQKFKLNEQLQKDVDKFNQTLEEIVTKKESEIMEI